jgi:hypothetical protein
MNHTSLPSGESASQSAPSLVGSNISSNIARTTQPIQFRVPTCYEAQLKDPSFGTDSSGTTAVSEV